MSSHSVLQVNYQVLFLYELYVLKLSFMNGFIPKPHYNELIHRYNSF